MPSLSLPETIYLVGVIAAFGGFALTLGAVNLYLTIKR